MRSQLLVLGLVTLLFTQGCQTRPPIKTVDYVDLERFMGDWYVIASIPTYFEKEVYKGVETYRLDRDGTVETTFSFNKGGFDGPVKTYHPRGFIRDTASNAVWDMQFVWPFKAEYRIIYLNEAYTQTVIGRTKRDYVWIMARTPSMPPEAYNRILRFIEGQGYEIAKVRKVPQKQDPGE